MRIVEGVEPRAVGLTFLTLALFGLISWLCVAFPVVFVALLGSFVLCCFGSAIYQIWLMVLEERK